MRRLHRGAGLALCAAGLIATGPTATAHEGREVGEVHLVVGWGDEPAYVGFKNSVQVRVTDHDEEPVTDIGGLEVEVSFGPEKRMFALEPNFRVGAFGEPGDYRAWFLPTRPGTYSFRLTGRIQGRKINEKFTCGERTFDCMKDVAEVQFPAKDPSTGQLAERLDREFPRAERRIAAAADDADSARLLGIIGIALGVSAIVAALLRRRSKGAA